MCTKSTSLQIAEKIYVTSLYITSKKVPTFAKKEPIQAIDRLCFPIGALIPEIRILVLKENLEEGKFYWLSIFCRKKVKGSVHLHKAIVPITNFVYKNLRGSFHWLFTKRVGMDSDPVIGSRRVLLNVA